MLGISVRSLERLLAAGKLPCVRIAGSVRLSEPDIETFIEDSRELRPRKAADDGRGIA